MEPRPAAAALLLADGRWPTGGHAHSGGLEEAVVRRAVTDRTSLGAWLLGRLQTTGRVEAAFAAAAVQEAAAHRPGGDCRWELLHAELAARLPSTATRRASAAQGRGLLRTASAAWPAPWIAELRSIMPGGTLWPVALGAVAAAAGLAAADAALLAASAALQGPAWASTRLLGLDPADVAGALADLAAATDQVALDAAALVLDQGEGGCDPRELPGCAAPLTDIGAELHATWEVRLFAS